MMRIDPDGFIEVGHGAFLVAFRYLCNSAVVVGHHVTAIAFHCLVEVRQRAIQITFIETEASPVVPRRRKTRSNIQRVGVVRYSLHDISARFLITTMSTGDARDNRRRLDGG